MNVRNPANELKKDQHVFVAGKTGSGKSELVQTYLAGSNFPNVICLDSKGRVDWPQVPDVAMFTRLNDLMKFGSGKAIYRPDINELNQEYYNAFFEWCYSRGNTTVWVDELAQVYEESSKILPYHQAILTRGRDLPQGSVNIWNVTQRPIGIPLQAISQSTHFFIFKLTMEEERRRIYKVIGQQKVLENPPVQYAFWYYNDYMDDVVLGKLNLRKGV